jgi:hypothetical protein
MDILQAPVRRKACRMKDRIRARFMTSTAGAAESFSTMRNFPRRLGQKRNRREVIARHERCGN